MNMIERSWAHAGSSRVSLGWRIRDEDVDDLHCTDQVSEPANAALLRFISFAAAVLALIKSMGELGLLLEDVGPACVWRCRSGSGLWLWVSGWVSSGVRSVCLLEVVGSAGAWKRSDSGLCVWAFG